MGVREKFFQAENIYFVTFTIFGWQKVFTSKKYYDLFYKWFDYQKEGLLTFRYTKQYPSKTIDKASI